MQKKTSEIQVSLRAKRKKSCLEIIGNLIIWLSPILLMILTIAGDWNNVTKSSTGTKLQLWAIIVLFVMMLVYYKWIRIKLHDKIQEKNINAEKAGPILTFCNSIMALLPFVFALLAFNFLNNLSQPITKFLLVLLAAEALGRLFLFIDSFREAKYK